jgi:hypothetical protein
VTMTNATTVVRRWKLVVLGFAVVSADACTTNGVTVRRQRPRRLDS